MAMAAVVLGHHQQPGGVLVQPVNDARTRLAADARQRPAVKQQRVDQRAAGMPGRRMDHQASRLVDHQQVVVFVQDVERQGFGGKLGRTRRRDVQRNGFAPAHPVIGGQRAAGGGRPALLDEPLDLRARQACPRPRPGVGEARRQDLVEPRAGIFCRDDQGKPLAGVQFSTLAVRKASKISSPTPTQMALSATLKAGQW